MKGNYGQIAKHILLAVGITGVVLTVAAVPGVVLAVKLFELDKEPFPKKYDKQKAARTIQRLQKSKLLRIREKDGQVIIELTREGKKKFKDLQLENLCITKPPIWDNKWRVVIFDIPDKSFKRGRDALRGKLKEWDFYQLQKSVWVCPWPCEREVQFIAELYDIGSYVNIMITEKILEDSSVRKHFGL